VRLGRHVLLAAVTARGGSGSVRVRVQARQLTLALLHRLIHVVVPAEVARAPRYLTKVLQLITVGKALETYDVDVEVGHCLSGGSAVLHSELQPFAVEAAGHGHAHALRELPHVGDLSGEEVAEEGAAGACGDKNMAGHSGAQVYKGEGERGGGKHGGGGDGVGAESERGWR
jgi:hypothetical protein